MRNISDLALLKEVRAFLPRHWIQGMNAATITKKAEYVRCSPLDKSAVRWCLRGACIRVLNPSFSELTTQFILNGKIKQIPRALGFKDDKEINIWNDDPYREEWEVMELLDDQIWALDNGRKIAQ